MQEFTGWLLLAGGLLFTADRVATALSNLGVWPARWRRFDIARARDMVAREEREAKLDLVIAEFSRNGGNSMRDRIEAIASEQQRLAAEQRHTQVLVSEHIAYAHEADTQAREHLERIDRRLAAGDRQFAEIRDLLQERTAS